MLRKAIPLSFNKFDTFELVAKPLNVTEKKEPLVICHGLFGSKQNWKSLAKTLSVQSQCEVYTMDARNHGESPHDDQHTYEAMAHDMIQFIKENKLNNPMLMGHSMGGKVMMTIALQEPTLVSKLVVIDMPPLRIQLGDEYSTYVKAMREINQMQLTKQKEADSVLQKYVPDILIRQFLLTNLKKNLNKNGIYEFRIPFEILGRSIENMGDFIKSDKVYTGPTLFITGDKSEYKREFIQQPALIKKQFPNSTIENIKEAGHWVQAEQPDKFIKIATRFLNKS